ncbi:DinB family protein [Ekhidna sp.]
MIEDFKKLFLRDLDRLRTELEAYTNEEDLWVKTEGINNSAGNLIMHLCGNLQHFIGTVLNETGYVRQREFEFEGRMIFDQLMKQVEATIKLVSEYFETVEKEELMSTYPLELFGHPMTVHYFLMHLQGHLNYHLGQINYHRRILF